ncbi:receptor protein kinase TMK1-like [Trifolium pratense]|uniref:receptor protein kinase TMK1-like n=1 Tax=Trifolium pratense TaxID=57577 RepID=UPI001E6953B7|nr:receptor protein kinase TMK1-like [Trifolium pratense]
MGFGVSYVVHVLVLFSVMFVCAWSQSQDDGAVMQKLKTAISKSNLNWSDDDFCNWEKVQCSGRRVTSIEIPQNHNVEGSLPKELVQLTELTDFRCTGNDLSGVVPYMPNSLQNLYIDNNTFTSMPNDFFNNLTNLIEVGIGYNPFPQWQIPSSLKNCLALKKFSANNASFVGQIPEFFGTVTFPSLTDLLLAYNSLDGNLPNSLSGSSIQTLWVNGQNSINKLNGTLSVLQNMTSLQQIWVQSNNFTGPIPDLSNLDQLVSVSFRDNQLTGVVPASLTSLQSLKNVGLSNNNLQGSRPKFSDGVEVDMGYGNNFCTKNVGEPCSPLVNVLLSVVEPLGYPLILAQSWKSNDPCDGSWSPYITCSNGNITTINFQNKGFSGSISPSFASLTSVTRLLLAKNNLTGTIPKELASMPALKELDVSNNKLYGQIPSFRAGVVVNTNGNPDIGKDKPHGSPDSSSGGEDKKKNGVGAIIGVVMGIIGLLVVGVSVFVICRRRHNKRDGKVQTPNAIVVHPHHSGDGNAVKISVAASGIAGAGIAGGTSGFSPSSSVQNVEAGNMVISIQVLREVTDNFSEKNILGKGGFGTVYKGELADGTKIAVKRMQSEMVGDKGLNEFKSEIAVLTKVRHRHLVGLLGYCLEDNEKLLVYEYMPQGTLSEHLFDRKDDGSKPLDWKTRLSIALDVARGVEYLHGLAQHSFIHRDLKPSNILLGDDMRAKVSDFGLVRLAPEGQASFETRLAGTFGYLAPEYAVTGRVTTKVDVYSYGVILMEIITGRRAIDNSQPEENMHLVTWFRRILLNKDSFGKVIDPAMDINEEGLESFRDIAGLASHCCAREPHQRPEMGQIVNVLAPLVEIWKPAELDDDDIYGIDLEMSLPQVLSKWKNLEGMSNTLDASSSMSANIENTQSSIPARSSYPFTSAEAR